MSEEIGNILKTARKKKRYTVKSVAKRMKVVERYIDQIEKGNFTEISKDIYLIGYIKNYAELLDLDSDDLVKKIKQEEKASNLNKELSTETSAFSYSDQAALKPSRIIIIGSLLFTLIAYVAWYNIATVDSIPQIISLSFDRISEDIPDPVVVEEEASKMATGKVFSKDALILMAKDKVTLNIYDEKEVLTFGQEMQPGEICFLDAGVTWLVEASFPSAIEVFGGEASDTLLGSLQEVLADGALLDSVN